MKITTADCIKFLLDSGKITQEEAKRTIRVFKKKTSKGIVRLMGVKEEPGGPDTIESHFYILEQAGELSFTTWDRPGEGWIYELSQEEEGFMLSLTSEKKVPGYRGDDNLPSFIEEPLVKIGFEVEEFYAVSDAAHINEGKIKEQLNALGFTEVSDMEEYCDEHFNKQILAEKDTQCNIITKIVCKRHKNAKAYFQIATSEGCLPVDRKGIIREGRWDGKHVSKLDKAGISIRDVTGMCMRCEDETDIDVYFEDGTVLKSKWSAYPELSNTEKAFEKAFGIKIVRK
jgi:hypothetical protein